MILLSSIIKRFERSYRAKYSPLPSHLKALNAMKSCRTTSSYHMQVKCSDCNQQIYIPHSCGHRNCPHCQAHESQLWIDKQLKRQVPANYFMITFTLPKELRQITWRNQRQLYNIIFECSKNTLQTFTKNDKQLGGTAGLMSVLHTHARNLDYHPHIHFIIPAASINQKNKAWRTKKGKYLFNHKALAKVFRAKMINKMEQLKLPLSKISENWIVNCKHVGKGNKAIVYLGKYLYRGVICEKNIISYSDGKVTFRYINSKTKKYQTRTVSGEYFLYLILQHVLPKGFRRARNYGFAHPNCKKLIAVIHYILKFTPIKFKPQKRPKIVCKCCGAVMNIIQTRLSKAAILGMVPT